MFLILLQVPFQLLLIVLKHDFQDHLCVWVSKDYSCGNLTLRFNSFLAADSWFAMCGSDYYMREKKRCRARRLGGRQHSVQWEAGSGEGAPALPARWLHALFFFNSKHSTSAPAERRRRRTSLCASPGGNTTMWQLTEQTQVLWRSATLLLMHGDTTGRKPDTSEIWRRIYAGLHRLHELAFWDFCLRATWRKWQW